MHTCRNTMREEYSFCILFVAATIHVSASRFSPRHSTNSDAYDPYIICEGAGPSHDEGLPSAYDQDDYGLNLNLCSAVHGVPRHNVGCSCTRARGNVQCHESVADPNLYNAMYKSSDESEIEDAVERGFLDGEMPFWEYCWSNCLCVDAETAHESETNTSLAVSLLHRFRVAELARQRNESAGRTYWNAFTGGSFSHGSFEGSTQASGQPAVQMQCGNNCTTSQDCQGPSSAGPGKAAEQGSHCTCRTQSSQYQPGSGLVAYAAACLIDMATGGKREEEWPCPCNSSYVSHGCCEARDGLVWEVSEYKLGELVK